MAPKFNCMGFHTRWGSAHPSGLFWGQFSYWLELCVFPSLSSLLDRLVFSVDRFGFDHWRS